MQRPSTTLRRSSVAAKPRREHKLDPAEAGAGRPLWSPDGRKVTFSSDGRRGVPGGPRDISLYLKTLKPGAVTLLSATARGEPS